MSWWLCCFTGGPITHSRSKHLVFVVVIVLFLWSSWGLHWRKFCIQSSLSCCLWLSPFPYLLVHALGLVSAVGSSGSFWDAMSQSQAQRDTGGSWEVERICLRPFLFCKVLSGASSIITLPQRRRGKSNWGRVRFIKSDKESLPQPSALFLFP